jgi:hypothetical protein
MLEPRLSQIGFEGETMEINGIAHIFLTASNFEAASSKG